MLTYGAGEEVRERLTHADVCGRMRTYADVCGRMVQARRFVSGCEEDERDSPIVLLQVQKKKRERERERERDSPIVLLQMLSKVRYFST
jgi:hypothetical protein